MAYINRELALELLKRNSSTEHITFSDGVSIYDTIANIPAADVVPKSEGGADCPVCHGTGRIGTTDWLTKHLSEKQLAEEKAMAIAEHDQHIKSEVAREIFEQVDGITDLLAKGLVGELEFYDMLAELKKKYTNN